MTARPEYNANKGVTRMSDADCLFCKIAAGAIPADIVKQGPDWVAFRDISPQAPTHILIIPRQHIATLNDVGPEKADLLGGLFLAAKEIAAEEGIACPPVGRPRHGLAAGLALTAVAALDYYASKQRRFASRLGPPEAEGDGFGRRPAA
jgi:hypothetical protein